MNIHNLKTYFLSFFLSLLCILIPWMLAAFGIVSEVDVLSRYAFLSILISMILSGVIVLRSTREWRARLLMLILNPAILYLVLLLLFIQAFSRGDAFQFNKLIP